MDAAALARDDLDRLALRFAPAVRLVQSDWPLHAIWAHAMADGPHPPALPQDVLITRPDFDPVPHPLSRAEGAFVAALLAGDTLGGALDPAMTADPGFDPTRALTLLLSAAALTDIFPMEAR